TCCLLGRFGLGWTGEDARLSTKLKKLASPQNYWTGGDARLSTLAGGGARATHFMQIFILRFCHDLAKWFRVRLRGPVFAGRFRAWLLFLVARSAPGRLSI